MRESADKKRPSSSVASGHEVGNGTEAFEDKRPVARQMMILQKKIDTRTTKNPIPSQGPPLQAKTLSQAGLDKELGISSSGERIKIIGSNSHDGIAYENSGFAPAKDREDAMKQSAAMAAKVGMAVQSWADQDKSRRVKGRMYTTADFDDAIVPTLDPFVHETKFDVQDPDHAFGMFYQHSNDMDGYVIAIIEVDGKGKNLSGAMTKGKESVTDSADFQPYASNHDKHKGNLLAATEAENKGRFDAITKLTGEGARFECVYKHMGKLQDDTIFYTKEGGNFRGIHFQQLYVVWITEFKGKFAISNQMLADAIRGKKELLGTKRGGRARPKYPLPLLKAEEIQLHDYCLDIDQDSSDGKVESKKEESKDGDRA